VRKISGFNTPSKANEAVFQSAVDEIAKTSAQFLGSAPIDGSSEE
jgi:hypothetical protein